MAMTPETPETPETDARKIVWRGLSAEPPPEHGPLDVPFDQYQRYRVTADLIGAAGSGASGTNGVAATRVLDVGDHHSDF